MTLKNRGILITVSGSGLVSCTVLIFMSLSVHAFVKKNTILGELITMNKTRDSHGHAWMERECLFLDAGYLTRTKNPLLDTYCFAWHS